MSEEIECPSCGIYEVPPRKYCDCEDKHIFVSIRRELLDEVIDRLKSGKEFGRSMILCGEGSNTPDEDINKMIQEGMELLKNDIEETIEKLERLR